MHKLGSRLSGRLNIQQFLAFVFGIVFIVILLVLAIIFPNPTPFQNLVFRVVLSLAAAGVGAMIPGFITVDMSLRTRIGISAAGAFSVFLIIYLLNPAQLVIGLEPNGPISIIVPVGRYKSDSFDSNDPNVKSEGIRDFLQNLGVNPVNICTGGCSGQGDCKPYQLRSSRDDQADLSLETDSDKTIYILDVADSGEGKGKVELWIECRGL